ncbi:hypothetical protein J5893_00100 [bacterium]|nr:hypothetical protein [bacterium]
MSPHFSESLQQVSQEIRSIRASKLPDWREIGTAGSFFKNPVVSSQLFSSLQEKFEGIVGYQLDTASVGSEELDGSRAEKNVKLSAAWLIEHAGMKGFRYGTAGVYEKHALILVNYGGGSEDVLEVMKRVQVAVQEKFGIVLEPEVVIV